MAPVPRRSKQEDEEGRRSASAGQAITVVLLTLVIAAFVNADSLVASIEGQSFGTSRTVGLALAKPVRTISHWTGLNRPRRLIDDAVTRYESRSTEAAAPARRPPGSAPPISTTTTVPVPRVPSTNQPLRVWLAGDSLMGTISESFINTDGGNRLLSATENYQVGTGLARPDVYNWPAAIGQEMATVNPDVVILLFGANDDQDMEVAGHRLSLQSPQWQQEYANRVNQILDEMANGARQVIWLAVPAVRRPRLNQTKDIINTIVQTAAKTHPNVTYLDTGALVDGPGNSFTTYLHDASGKAITVRDTDGIHITLEGAALVTPVLETDIEELWHLPG